MMRPPIPYYGGKQTIGPTIAALLPEHEHYVEPYCGSLAVLLAKRPSHMETVNDIDGELMTFWRVLRDRPAELARVCALTPHSRAELQAAHESAGDELEIARRAWVRLTQGRNGTLRRSGWRHHIAPAQDVPMPTYLAAYVQRLAPAAERLRMVSLECMQAIDMIAKYGTRADVLIYVDPPYAGDRARGYRHEMAADDDHRQLAEALTATQAAVVVSGYHSPLYDQLYDGWHRHEIRTGTPQGGSWQPRIEVLWSNRPLGGQGALWDDMPGEDATAGGGQ